MKPFATTLSEKIFLVVFLVLVVLGVAAIATERAEAADKECKTADEVHALAISGLPEKVQKTISVRKLPQDKVDQFVAAVNSFAGPDIVGDALTFISTPELPGLTYVIKGIDGCFTGEVVPNETMRKIWLQAQKMLNKGYKPESKEQGA